MKQYFGSMLNRFFALYAAIHLFNQLTLMCSLARSVCAGMKTTVRGYQVDRLIAQPTKPGICQQPRKLCCLPTPTRSPPCPTRHHPPPR